MRRCTNAARSAATASPIAPTERPELFTPLDRGRIDLQAGRLAANTLFLHSSLYCVFQSNSICGNPAMIFKDSNLPYYPDPSWRADAKVSVASRVYVHAGAFLVDDGRTMERMMSIHSRRVPAILLLGIAALAPAGAPAATGPGSPTFTGTVTHVSARAISVRDSSKRTRSFSIVPTDGFGMLSPGGKTTYQMSGIRVGWRIKVDYDRSAAGELHADHVFLLTRVAK